MAWKKGPLPPGTYHWGGVVTKDMSRKVVGFLFADFCGDHVKVHGEGGGMDKVIPADDVVWYDNSLELPPS